MTRHRNVDVLILGGGPAGATAAAVLARGGIEAVVVDAAGEPLCRHDAELVVPGCLPILDELGLGARVAELPSSLPVPAITIVSATSEQRLTVPMLGAPGERRGGLAVSRAALRSLLLTRAQELGAELLAGRATSASWDGMRFANLTVRDDEGREHMLHCRVLLDASGHASFVANRMGWRFPYPTHRSSVVATELPPGGGTPTSAAVLLARGGWFWSLSLADGGTTLGLVREQRSVRESQEQIEEAFHRTLAGTQRALELVGSGGVGPLSAVQACAYRVMATSGDGFCLLGDAAGFLDPFLAPGLVAALATGESAGIDVADALLRRGKVAGHDFGPTIALTRALRRIYLAFSRSFLDPRFLSLLMRLGQLADFNSSLSALMSGDVVRPQRFRRTLAVRLLVAAAELQRLLRIP
jgi:flavin-dependent dehydrogenase